MKRTLLALSFMIAASVASAQDDWVVTTTDSNNANITYVYTMLPKTVTQIARNDGPEQQVVIEYTTVSNGVSNNPTRFRLRVNGCGNGSGKVALANMAGELLKDGVIFDWVLGGDRVFDKLAVNGCYAWILKTSNVPSTPAKPIKSNTSV